MEVQWIRFTPLQYEARAERSGDKYFPASGAERSLAGQPETGFGQAGTTIDMRAVSLFVHRCCQSGMTPRACSELFRAK